MNPIMQNLPKILGLMIGLAASIAIGVGVFFWATKPNYTALYSGMESRDASEVVTALQQAGIPYELDSATGIVNVEPSRIHEARLKLAEQGLPRGTGAGMEMLQQEQSFGTSQFIENARYHNAMETELARTISTMRNVKSARVHLAIPKRSVFVRNQDKATASVALTLYGGRDIEQGQVNAIIHLVASSIPNLNAEQVTVVDQNGRLLSDGNDGNKVAMTAKQYEYTRKLEEDYISRIEHLLEPMMGVGRVRATVNADMDFSETESTEELFNPARQQNQVVLRSEQSSEKSSSEAEAAGVPGALTNQPPAGGQLQAGAGTVAGATVQPGTPVNSSKNTVRNYEVDRTIRHQRQEIGKVDRFTVAVLVDDHVVVEKGKEKRTPLTPDEIARISTLVQQVIGFNEQRGDKVDVINASFAPPEAEEVLPEPSLLDQAWVHNLGKQLLAGAIILILIFTVVRPTIRNISSYTVPVAALTSAGEAGGGGGGGQARLEQREGQIALPSNHEQKVEFAKSMVDQ
ncbi:MAG: flagellar M-ring protein FliF, partial [Pseudomonadota bacterium]|nr:flagellar M-ring protein FliF [Pseudomonadota bacterium]